MAVNKNHIALFVAVFALIALGNIGKVHAQTDNTPWPTMGQNNQRTGFRDVSSSEYGDNFVELWSSNLGVGTGEIRNSPVVGDINRDGSLEILIGITNDPLSSAQSSTVCLDNGGNIKWSYITDFRARGSPVIANLDADENYEVVVSEEDNRVHVLNADGSEKWTHEVHDKGLVVTMEHTPAVEDINNDGKNEIILGEFVQSYDNFVALNNDGSVYWATRPNDRNVRGSPAVGDIDGDGFSEILMGTDDGYMEALEHDGSVKWEFYIGPGYNSFYPAISDINNDGSKEVVFGSQDGNLYVLDGSGNELWHFPTGDDAGGSPAIGDVDGDSKKEIFFTSADGKIYAVDSSGSEIWSTLTPENTRMNTSPSIADVDGDGGMEIIVNTDDGTYILNEDGSIEFTSPIRTATPWGCERASAIADINEDGDYEMVWPGIENIYVIYDASPSSSTLNVKTNLPSDLSASINLKKPSGETVSALASPNKTFSGLSSGSYTVELDEGVGSYSLESVTIENAGVTTDNSVVKVHLSEENVIADYQKSSPPPVPPPPNPELGINTRLGKMIDDVFVPKESFVAGERVFVRAKVYYGDSFFANADVYAEWKGLKTDMRKRDGYYQGSFKIPPETNYGSHMVNITAETIHGDIEGSETFSVNSFPKPPKEDDFPDWYKYMAPLFLMAAIMALPKNEWANTPRNWLSESAPDSWTYSGEFKWVIGALAASFVALLLYYGLSMSTVFYGILTVTVIGIIFDEIHPDKGLAAIGFNGKKEAELAISGILFSLAFIYLSALAGKYIPGQIWSFSYFNQIKSYLPMTMSVLSTVLFVPMIEEGTFRSIIAPSLSERMGIIGAILGSGFSFGLAHVVFGATISLFVFSSIFGIVCAWILLRNQSLAFPILAHITYNFMVVVISLGWI